MPKYSEGKDFLWIMITMHTESNLPCCMNLVFLKSQIDQWLIVNVLESSRSKTKNEKNQHLSPNHTRDNNHNFTNRK